MKDWMPKKKIIYEPLVDGESYKTLEEARKKMHIDIGFNVGHDTFAKLISDGHLFVCPTREELAEFLCQKVYGRSLNNVNKSERDNLLHKSDAIIEFLKKKGEGGCMSEIIHEGQYEDKKVYVRPPNTYKCDGCGKDLGRNKGIELGMSWDKEIDGHEMTEYELANFCSFKCLHNYPQNEDSKRFVKQMKWADSYYFYINGFDWKDIAEAQSK